MDCVYAVDELNAQIKELQQQKLDNITEEFEAIAGYSEAVQGTSKAMVDYYTSIGKTVNSGEAKGQYNKQIKEQEKIVGYYRQERDAYKTELDKAEKVFGKDSVEFKNAKTAYEEINTAFIEAQSAVNNLRKELYELDLTKIERVIDRLTAFGERFASIVTLKEARGTMYGQPSSAITQQDYSRQITTNNDLIGKYMEDRQKRIEWLASHLDEVDSDTYKEYYDAIVKDEEAVMDLLEANEGLKDSIRTLRWKEFNDLQDRLDETKEDLQHLRGLMKDAQWFDKDGIKLTAEGYTNIALLGREITIGQQKIADYRLALEKLDKEYENGNISKEEYLETSREYTKVIQDEVNGVKQLRDEILEMYKSQITAENALLQRNISLRKEALNKKKAYYDYDKQIRDKNKDINQIKAQIAALSGVRSQAGQAELARLQEQLAEALEELNDTILQHQFDIQEQGYNKVADDAQKVLDDTLKTLERESTEADNIVNIMLDKTKSHWAEIYGENGVIDNLMAHTGTAIGTMANDMVNITETAFKQIQDKAKITVTFTVNADEVTKAINDAKIQMGYGNASTPGTVANAEATVKANNTEQTIKAEVDAKKKAEAEEAARKAAEEAKKKAAEEAKKNAPVELAKKTTTTGGGNNVSGKTASGLVVGSTGGAPDPKAPSGMPQFVAMDNKYLTDENYKKFVTLINSQAKGKAVKNDALTTMLNKGLAVSQLDKGIGKEIATLLGVKVSSTWTKEESANVVNALQASGWIERLQRDLKQTFDAIIKKHKKGKAASSDVLTKYLNSKYGITDIIGDANNLAAALGVKTPISGAGLVEILKLRGYKSGTRRVNEDELNWTHDGEIIRRSDGAILRQLNAGSQVFTKEQSDNLWEMSQIDASAIKQMVENVDFSKFVPQLTNAIRSSEPIGPQTVNIHYDSLLTVNGDVDREALPRLEEILKQAYQYTTKEMTREARKKGYRK